MNFLSLSSAWLGLLLIPLVAFYFLKLKRPRHIIPSLVLWRQVLDDQRVNSPFQRFKRNVLLWLQILILLLLVLAAMQPLWRRQLAHATRLPVLIDCSASMAALDGPGGSSRLAAAKKQVRALIDQMPGDQELALVAFSKSARRLTGFTNNPRELREALDALEVEDVAGDLEDGLRLVQALARGAAFDKVLLISDGNFPARANFDLPFKIDYQRLPAAGANFGITACSARRLVGDTWEVFVQVSGSPGADTTRGLLEVFKDGAKVSSEPLSLGADTAPRLGFKLQAEQASALEVRLTVEGFDALASDNLAWLSLPARRPLDLYVGKELGAFRHALEALEGLRIYPAESGPVPASFDLVITGQASELNQPTRLLCSVGLVPPELQKLITVTAGASKALDWRRESPLLEHVGLDEVVFMDDPSISSQTVEADLANAGFEVLVHGAHGPLMIQKRDRDALRVALIFDPQRSTLPYRIGFPILVSNLVHAALRESGLGEVKAEQTGTLALGNLTPNRGYRIEAPGQPARELSSNEFGQLPALNAWRAGLYVVGAGGSESRRVGVSVLSVSETALAGIDQIEFSDQLKVRATTANVSKSERSLWWPLACLALAFLLFEWAWFQKRPPSVA